MIKHAETRLYNRPLLPLHAGISCATILGTATSQKLPRTIGVAAVLPCDTTTVSCSVSPIPPLALPALTLQTPTCFASYARSLRVVQEELRDRVYNAADDRKALLTAEVSRRKAAAAAQEAVRVAATEEAIAPLLARFPGWVAEGTNGVRREPLFSAMLSFAEQFRHYRKVGASVRVCDGFSLLTCKHHVLCAVDQGSTSDSYLFLQGFPFSDEVNSAIQFPALRSTKVKQDGYMERTKFVKIVGAMVEGELPDDLVEKLASHLDKALNVTSSIAASTKPHFDSTASPSSGVATSTYATLTTNLYATVPLPPSPPSPSLSCLEEWYS